MNISDNKRIQVSVRADKTRARIIAYSGKVFYERGFRRITVEELCAGMAMSKRTFYKYFGNRDELVVAVVADRFGEIAPQVIKNLNSTKPIPEILENHFDLIGRQLFTAISTPMMSDVQTLMPELWERIEFFRNNVIRVVIQLIRRGQAQGMIRPDIDPDVLAKVMQGMMTSLANPHFLSSQDLTMEQLGKIMHTLILHGILAANGKESKNEPAN